MPWRPTQDLLALVELAAPSACAGCGLPGSRWCADCGTFLAASRPRPWRPTPCPPGLPPTWAGLAYRGPARAALVAWKEDGRVDLTPVLARALRPVLAAALQGSAPHARAVRAGRPVVLVPAPSARAGVRARGRRPVPELARATTPRGPVVEALRLVRRVRDQAGLTAGERATNLRGAVAVRPGRGDRLRGVPCVLVDDVVTTGATLQECARALLAAGSGPVVAVTVCATVRRGPGPAGPPGPSVASPGPAD
ncbi:ComF family protein [Ornithinimicrobium flavum]|uniref:ComF family protein n=1 Tax=Ornithinimicrobium flavum TaxID=1288636 RepID=UPI001070222E|nr:phosphoribosyltransferase family protein [Ornithinimicrobium flavum]